MQNDIKEPPFPLDEDDAQGCLTFVDGKLVYYLDRRGKAHLLWHLWYCYAEAPTGEDPGLRINDYYGSLTTKMEHIRYSETIVLEDDDRERRNRSYPLGYREIPQYRLDFYVLRSEFKQAFLAVRRLGRKQGDRRIEDAVIFGGVRVVLREGSAFEDRRYWSVYGPVPWES